MRRYERPPETGCAMLCVFVSGIIGLGAAAAGEILLAAVGFGLAVLCMLSAICQKLSR